jgi:hypothetical protein
VTFGLLVTGAGFMQPGEAHAIRRELASVYRDMRNGTIETQEGTRLAYVLDMIRKAYETSVIQERLELMERTIAHRKN